MSKSSPNPIHESRLLRERAAWLLSPARRTGPSPHEAQAEAQACRDRADRIDCDLFYAGHKSCNSPSSL